MDKYPNNETRESQHYDHEGDYDMAAKDFTPEQNQLLDEALKMYMASYERRVTAESDQEAKAVWQKKIDKAAILASKVRLT